MIRWICGLDRSFQQRKHKYAGAVCTANSYVINFTSNIKHFSHQIVKFNINVSDSAAQNPIAPSLPNKTWIIDESLRAHENKRNRIIKHTCYWHINV